METSSAAEMPPPGEFKIPTPITPALNTVPKVEAQPNEPDYPDDTFKNPLPKSIELPRQQIEPKCTYKEPTWSTTPPEDQDYSIEVLKSGTIVENFKNLQSNPYWLFGKLPSNNIVMAHPTISRYHAVLQYRPEIGTAPKDNDDDDEDSDEDEETNKKNIKPKIEKGWYLYDLSSTHGTFLNKMRIPPRTYVRARVGHMFKFGCSTRVYILQGPDFDQEAASELTITELKEKKKQLQVEKQELEIMEEKKREEEGISWGMAEDADAETDLSVNPYATTNNEEMFLQDPKKTLRGFFEREGLNLEYKVDEMSAGTFVCRVELPIDDANGRQIVAEVCHKGKKKEVVLQTALEACRILDRHGVLRQANHESRQRKPQQSDSDEDDDFLDRTGDVERRRIKRAAASANNAALSYEELLKEEEELNESILSIDKHILKYQELNKKEKQKAATDVDLDDFMNNLSGEKVADKTEIRRLRVEQQRLRNDKLKLLKLIKIARPIELPPLQSAAGSTASDARKIGLKQIYGKRFTAAKMEIKSKISTAVTASETFKSDEEEIEEHDNPDHNSSVELIRLEEASSVEKLQEGVILEKAESQIKPCIKMQQSPQKKAVNIKPSEIYNGETLNKEENIIEVEKLSGHKREHPEEMREDSQINESSSSAIPQSKKKRNRVRVRGERRENVDMDDKEELQDADKYSKWVPPQNQQGDGYTSLNDKYGY